jgi:tetratricopeptide (TPR) repeat protein
MGNEGHDPFIRVYQLCNQGKLAAALRVLIDPAACQLRKVFRFDCNHAWYCVGDILFKQRKVGEACDAFKKSLRTRPDDIDVLMAIGNCYDELQRPKIAERYFQKALDLSPQKNNNKRQSILLNLGNSLFDQGKFDKAAVVYRQLLRAPGEIGIRARKNLSIAMPAQPRK